MSVNTRKPSWTGSKSSSSSSAGYVGPMPPKPAQRSDSFYVMDVYSAWVDKSVRKRTPVKDPKAAINTRDNDELAVGGDMMEAQKRAPKRRSMKSKVRDELGGQLSTYLEQQKIGSVVYMILLGMLCSFLGFFVNYCVTWISKGRVYISTMFDSPWLNLLMYWGSSLVLITCSAGCTKFISAASAGSGIAQLKAILGGVMLFQYLDMNALIGKVIGLIFALGAGISIGKEGPYIHIAAIVAHQLCRFPMFKHIDQNALRKLSMLSCACAAGIAANFGCVMGGVIFSIEVTSTTYFISNLPKAFFVALVAALVIKTLSTVQTAPDIYALLNAGDSIFVPSRMWFQLLSFFVLGAICGLIAALFVVIVSHVTRAVKQRISFFKKHRFVFLWIVVTITCFTMFPFEFIKWGDRHNIHALIKGVLDASWSTPSIITSLSVFIMIKFCITLFSPALAVPAGAFLPVFVLGAAVGRLFGELVEFWFPSLMENASATYAVVGAAAVSGGVTSSISTSIITYELVGNIDFLVPLMISVMVSIGIAKLFTPSIYDTLAAIAKLPVLPSKPGTRSGTVTADIMRRNLATISKTSTYSDLENALNEAPDQYFFPVVTQGHAVVGAVQRAVLEQAVYGHHKLFLLSRSASAMDSFSRKLPAGVIIPSPIRRVSVWCMGKILLIPGAKTFVKICTKFSAFLSWLFRLLVSISTGRGKDPPTIDGSDNNLMDSESAADGIESMNSEDRVENVSESAESDHALSLSSVTASGKGDDDDDDDGGNMRENANNDINNNEDESEDENMVNFARAAFFDIPNTMDFDDPNVMTVVPFQIMAHSPVDAVWTLFRMLGVEHMFVTAPGRLVGMVTKRDLLWRGTKPPEALAAQGARDKSVRIKIGGKNKSSPIASSREPVIGDYAVPVDGENAYDDNDIVDIESWSSSDGGSMSSGSSDSGSGSGDWMEAGSGGGGGGGGVGNVDDLRMSPVHVDGEIGFSGPGNEFDEPRLIGEYAHGDEHVENAGTKDIKDGNVTIQDRGRDRNEEESLEREGISLDSFPPKNGPFSTPNLANNNAYHRGGGGGKSESSLRRVWTHVVTEDDYEEEDGMKFVDDENDADQMVLEDVGDVDDEL